MKDGSPAPILLFVYNRLNTLKQTVDSLKRNKLASESELFIFQDAPREPKDLVKTKAVSDYIVSINGFRKIQIIRSVKNKGLANSIITGVSSVIEEYGNVIVLEDDLVSSRNFLSFMNQALCYYRENPAIISVAGFSMPVQGLRTNDVYFTGRSSSWGWATWKDRWKGVDWEVKDYNGFISDKTSRNAFNKMGSDMSAMLTKQMQGKINSWAIRWCYHQFRNQLLTVYPAVSKIRNIGLEDPEATHTRERFSRFKTNLDNTENESFVFPGYPVLDPGIIRQFIKPYSIPARVKYKLLNSIAGL